ncbi:hypothetical protein [Roseobacter sp. HKCCD7386]|uniref:hypothetical protein n=1 Tax=Roseobacter sp. HKCCD7386 TaxID=2690514 RepID=UPI001490E143|nr:hypothetical protein [Roseobacter sp. HKCCD7386]NNW38982.1 hypothetical protein [Roseobacter sp. HKCCD9117-2]
MTKMTGGRGWQESFPLVSCSSSERLLPLLPAALSRVFAGRVRLGLVLFAGCRAILAVNRYVFGGIADETGRARGIRDSIADRGFSIEGIQSLQGARPIILDARESWKLLCIDLSALDGAMNLDAVFEKRSSLADSC